MKIEVISHQTGAPVHQYDSDVVPRKGDWIEIPQEGLDDIGCMVHDVSHMLSKKGKRQTGILVSVDFIEQ